MTVILVVKTKPTSTKNNFLGNPNPLYRQDSYKLKQSFCYHDISCLMNETSGDLGCQEELYPENDEGID